MSCIMVVDDEQHICELLQVVFESMGYDVVLCENAESARNVMASRKPDLAFLDINLPGEDGVSLARFLRDRYPLLPVVVMSGLLDRRDQSELLEAGPSCLLRKPFEIAALKPLIADLLGLTEEFQVVRMHEKDSVESHVLHKSRTYQHQKVDGPISVEQLEETFEEELNRPVINGPQNILWDLRETSLADLAIKDIVALARSLKRYRLHQQGGKAAVLVGRSSDYCLAMVAKPFMLRSPRKMKVFRTLARAQQWLECSEAVGHS